MAVRNAFGLASALVLLMGLAAACGGGGTQESAAELPAAEDSAALTPSTPRPSFQVPHVVRTAATKPEAEAEAEEQPAFPHEEHRGVGCQTCHRRPATHVTHLGAECTACHSQIGEPGAPAATADPTSQRCASCHHGESRRAACTACHDTQAVGVRSVAAEIRVAGSSGSPAVRTLSFDHADHGTVQCATCHTTPLTRAFGVECATCHDSHHTPASECLACHDAGSVAAHDNRVHAGCGGSGCHADPTVLALPMGRNVCLVCHPTQVDHRPAEDCSTCHLVEEPRAAGSREESP